MTAKPRLQFGTVVLDPAPKCRVVRLGFPIPLRYFFPFDQSLMSSAKRMLTPARYISTGASSTDACAFYLFIRAHRT